MKLNVVDRFLTLKYKKLGSLIGSHPSYFVIVPIFLSCLLATGVQRINYISDIEYLFSPYHSKATEVKAFIEKNFITNMSYNFDPGRYTRRGRFGTLLLVTKNGKNILQKDIFERVIEIDQMIQSLTIHKDDKTWTYKELCCKDKDGCFSNSFIESLKHNNSHFKYPLDINKKNLKVYFYGGTLGGVTTHEDGYVISARAIRLLYFLDDDNNYKNDLSLLWERKFIKQLQNIQIEDLTSERYVSSSVETEFHNSTMALMPLLVLISFMMILFSALTSITSDWISNKPWSGVIGCMSSGLSVASSFGLLMYIGIPYIDMNLAAPFLTLGIGMDDTFVMLAAWRRTDTKKSVEERLGDAYSESSVSITITSLTNFITFCFGMTTPFRSIRIFSVYIVSCILFAYIYQLTFVGGCMAICGYTEQKGLHSITCMPVDPIKDKKNRGLLYRLFCLQVKNSEENKETILVTFWSKMSDVLNYSYVKVLIAAIFAIYLAGAAWGCTNLQEKVDLRDFVSYDSYVMRYFNTYIQYFQRYQTRIQIVLNATVDYSDPSVQQNIEEILQSFESSDHLSDSTLTESWLRHYLQFMKDKRGKILLETYNTSSKQGFLDGLREVFLRLPLASRYNYDIKFNENNTDIITSRFLCQTNKTTDTNSEINMALELRKLAEKTTLPILVYNTFFLFVDHNLMVLPLTLQTISIVSGVIAIVTFLFLPSIKSVICVTFTIISILVGVIGYMTLWHVKLDPIAMINLIMCVGFSVDYSTHVVYAFITCKDRTPGASLKKALCDVGLSIFQGSVSTIIGVIVFIDPPSYLYGVFFKIMLLVILFSALHGLIILPLLLSLTEGICLRSWKLPSSKDIIPSSNVSSIHKMPEDQLPTENGIETNHNSITLKKTISNKEYINEGFTPDLQVKTIKYES
ncbi:patched domain-containing protein 3-like isoform X1 [Centruroides vittatus]|uniref:patched domain-containing protein 3-like isoform X1 n=2 Tax=Centruroides vittatus TaxID=120091 RepID=UPI00350EF299